MELSMGAILLIRLAEVAGNTFAMSFGFVDEGKEAEKDFEGGDSWQAEVQELSLQLLRQSCSCNRSPPSSKRALRGIYRRIVVNNIVFAEMNSINNLLLHRLGLSSRVRVGG